MSEIVIYTDGACSNNKGKNKGLGGWGAVLCFGTNQKEIYGGEPNTTSNKMELTAVIQALKLIKTKKYPVKVYSDSAYIVDCMNQGWYYKWIQNGWKTKDGELVKNQDLWEWLISAKKVFNLSFVHVKGHSGILLNERADQLAVKGKKENQGYE